jgi:hypothetical protein
MLPFKKKSKGTAEIHLLPDIHKSQPIVWLSNEDICGRAVFKLPPNVTFSHAKIQLRGRKTPHATKIRLVLRSFRRCQHQDYGRP